MNRSSFAFFVALLIHVLFFLLFLYLSAIVPDIKKIPKEEKRIKISLKEFSKPKKNLPSAKKINIAPPLPKGKQLKKIIKKPHVYFKPKAAPKKPKFVPRSVPKKQIIQVNKTKPLQPKKPYIPLTQTKPKPIKKKQETTSMDWLMEDRSSEIRPEDNTNTPSMASAGKNIQELYGADFGKLSQGQQKYILDNQEIMRRITQDVLNRQASVSNINGLNVNKSNVIEFYLYPNGDISDFKFLEQSGYFILDDITKSTIEYAYSKYPRPTEKTLIRYNVFYNLMHY